jgi:hypothetical protein
MTSNKDKNIDYKTKDQEHKNINEILKTKNIIEEQKNNNKINNKENKNTYDKNKYDKYTIIRNSTFAEYVLENCVL